MAKNSNSPSLRIIIRGDAKHALEQIEEVKRGLEAMSGKQMKDPTPQLREGLKKTAAEADKTRGGFSRLTQSIQQFFSRMRQLSGIDRATAAFTRMTSSLTNLARSFLALQAVQSTLRFLSQSTEAALRAEAAFKGLESVATRSGTSVGEAWEAVKELTADGLLSPTEASAAIKNLLAMGYTAQEAAEMLRYAKDMAAFNRQGMLSLGEAVVGFTEGLKNENSAMSDNAGMTKNLSVILEEYARSIGKTVSQLSEAEKREAYLVGVRRESALFTGDAAKLAEGLAGSNARLAQSFTQLQERVGQAIGPLREFINLLLERGAVRPLTALAEGMQHLSVEIGGLGAKAAAFFKAWGEGENWEERKKAFQRYVEAIDEETHKQHQQINDPGALAAQEEALRQAQEPVTVQAVRARQRERRFNELREETEERIRILMEGEKQETGVRSGGLQARREALEEALAEERIALEEFNRQRAEIDLEAAKARRDALTEQIQLAKQLAEEAKGGPDEDVWAPRIQELANALAEEREAVREAQNDLNNLRERAARDAERQLRESLRAEREVHESEIDARLTRERARIDTERAMLERSYAQNLIDYKQFVEQKHALDRQDLNARAQAINDQIALYRKLFEQAYTIDPEAAKQFAAQIRRLESELDRLEQEGVQIDVQLDIDRDEAQRQLDEFELNLKVRLLDAEGRSLEARLLEIQAELDEALKKTNSAEQQAMMRRIASLEAERAQFQNAQNEAEIALARHSMNVDAANWDLEWGNIGPGAWDKRIRESKEETIAVLKEYIATMEAAAAATNDPKMKLAVDQLKEQLRRLEQDVSETARTINRALADGIITALEQIVSKSMTARDAFKQLAVGILTEIQKILHQKLAAQLFAWLGGSDVGWRGGVGGIISRGFRFFGLGASTGGYVTGPGTSTSDSIPARLSNGEYVIRAAAVRAIGVDVLHYLNRTGKLPKGFAEGGPVGAGWLGQAVTRFVGDATQNRPEIRNIVLIDRQDIQDAMANSGGERVTLNHIRANIGLIKSWMGVG